MFVRSSPLLLPHTRPGLAGFFGGFLCCSSSLGLLPVPPRSSWTPPSQQTSQPFIAFGFTPPAAEREVRAHGYANIDDAWATTWFRHDFCTWCSSLCNVRQPCARTWEASALFLCCLDVIAVSLFGFLRCLCSMLG